MSERICERCRRVCFSQEQFENHECFDLDDKLDAEIALCDALIAKWRKEADSYLGPAGLTVNVGRAGGLGDCADELEQALRAHAEAAPHQHVWRVIYGDPATGSPQVEACDICNETRAASEHGEPAPGLREKSWQEVEELASKVCNEDDNCAVCQIRKIARAALTAPVPK